MIGVLEMSPDKFTFPVSATAMKKNVWIIQGASVLHNGVKVCAAYLKYLFFFFYINFFIQTDMQVSIFQKMCEIFPQQKITRGKIKSHVSSPNK